MGTNDVDWCLAKDNCWSNNLCSYHSRLLQKKSIQSQVFLLTVADLGGGAGGAPPPPGTPILSISCSFRENLAKSHVGAPLGSWHPPGKILDPPLIDDCRRLLPMSVVPGHRRHISQRWPASKLEQETQTETSIQDDIIHW